MGSMGTTQRPETEDSCSGGLACSSNEASIMGVEQRGQVIQFHNTNQLERG